MSLKKNLLKRFFWKTFYSHWPRLSEPRKDGYTLLLLIPGDLPVFLKIVLEVCKRQDPTHCVDAIVIPDQPSANFRAIFDRFQADWQGPPLRLAELNPGESFLTKRFNNPHINCWLQITKGIGAAKTTHALWHDADLFINDADFLRRHYELCEQGKLACMGVSPAWDKFFSEHGYDYLTSTWELMINVEWMRQWAPWEHRGQWRQLAGVDHEFDILFWAQCQTPRESVGRHDGAHSFVHFNYVIATYRWFQLSTGPFEDHRFRLLLVRMLINAFDDSGWVYEVPHIPELASGLRDGTQRVTYLTEETRDNYPEFRQKLTQLLASDLLDAAKKNRISADIAAFDDYFSLQADSSSQLPSAAR